VGRSGQGEGCSARVRCPLFGLDNSRATVGLWETRGRIEMGLFQDGDASRSGRINSNALPMYWPISTRRSSRRTLTFPDIACTR
jgi:hypothetical protein